jgi:hypothetical protein
MRTTKMAIREIDLGRPNDNPPYWPTDFEFTDKESVKIIEEQHPEMTKEFRRIMWHQYETFCKKQRNYGKSNISIGTDLSTPEDIRLSLTGIWFRSNDKMQRWRQLVMNSIKDTVGESVTDTFQDLSVYAIIAQLVQNGKWGK